LNKSYPSKQIKSINCKAITLGLLSPEEILERSFGEVLKPETINYRSYKPEKEGLFCEKIFGPIKDWECHCGKYKGIRYRGIVCDRCGVEVTRKNVRRERLGHITLAVPVVHIWFLKSIPSKLSYLLGYTTKQLESVTYYEKYVVTNPGSSEIETGALIDEDEFLDLDEKHGINAVSEDDKDNDNYFKAYMGGRAILELLKALDIESLINELSAIVHDKKVSASKKEGALKRLRILKHFDPKIEKVLTNKPEWMVISILPVIPPELRPLVPLDGGRFAASDLNDLYRRVVIRNNRLKQLMEIKAPDVILRNEKRMLQEAVDALLDNSRVQSAVRSGTRRPLKSLSDALKGKSGRFRQNLLGKRVDYSGRSVIVVGPELRLHECGIPKEMAIELFKPMIIHELMKRGLTRTAKSAKIMIDRKEEDVFSILEYVVSNHPILLNRAPTLHRLGIQAFQPKLVEGRAIRLHPLVCSAFNADFDGDQMAVHVPLSAEAKTEAWVLMLASHNILHPAHGRPIAIPSQEMILGCYYLTRPRDGEIGEGSILGSYTEAELAYVNEEIALHAKVKFRLDGEIIDTTLGRIMFNSVLPDGFEFQNRMIGKKEMVEIISKSYHELGNYNTVQFLDGLKDLGFEAAYKGGLSIAISDIHIPKLKNKIIDEADKVVDGIREKFRKHILTEGERYNKTIDVWTHATADVANEMFKELKAEDQGFNPLYMMADSGARGSQDQIKQLAGMRGLMAKPRKSSTGSGSSGEIIENPIKSNFKEGLSVFEYFISTHGARKGLADTALKTADAGYLTRRLVDVAQDITIKQEDCGTIQGLQLEDLKEGEEVIEPLEDRIWGRYTTEDVADPVSGDIIFKKDQLIDYSALEKITKSNVYIVNVRSVLTCESISGVCQKCYGLNLANNRLAQIGDAVGIMAAQSIGEPGTQLTLRTFHIGGTAARIIEQSSVTSKKEGIIKFSKNVNLEKVKNDDKTFSMISTNRIGEISLFDKNKSELNKWKIPYGSEVLIKDGVKIKVGDILFAWDPYTDVILARHNGIVSYRDLIEGETYVKEAVEGGKKMAVVTESRNRNLSPHIEILDEGTKDRSSKGSSSILPVKATIIVNEGDKVKSGEIIVKIPRDVGKTKDITGGLPRIAELFEARNPSNPAVVSDIDGKIVYGKIKRGIREIGVTSKENQLTYKIPYGKHILVHDGDQVFAGEKICEGSISPKDILRIKGASRVQEYLVEAIQEVYQVQGVAINDKHIEVIVKQMMQKVVIEDGGNTEHLPGDRVSKVKLKNSNIEISKMSIIKNPGDSDYNIGDLVSNKNIQEYNLELKAGNKKTIKKTKAKPATSSPLLLGITRASLNTESFISAASFQETTRVLTDAAVAAKTDNLTGLKENVIIGRLIPAGTGALKNRDIIVSKPQKDLENNTDKEILVAKEI